MKYENRMRICFKALNGLLHPDDYFINGRETVVGVADLIVLVYHQDMPYNIVSNLIKTITDPRDEDFLLDIFKTQEYTLLKFTYP
jgi:hypothetical protein